MPRHRSNRNFPEIIHSDRRVFAASTSISTDVPRARRNATLRGRRALSRRTRRRRKTVLFLFLAAPCPPAPPPPSIDAHGAVRTRRYRLRTGEKSPRRPSNELNRSTRRQRRDVCGARVTRTPKNSTAQRTARASPVEVTGGSTNPLITRVSENITTPPPSARHSAARVKRPGAR